MTYSLSKLLVENFYNISSYNGKTCDLYIKIVNNDTLISVSSDESNPTLCQAVISAIQLIRTQNYLNLYIYENFKNIMLRFSLH
ncbi:cell envelope integrity TolA C-terminal domain-containing protein [Candidatus Gullanella endobia]|uniref:cell envelope integrity TolA C-terminal domain-containing protein n=1 Tax=Candidatus Gullanella endobia TaxID=1070130 RepID=UPI0038B99607